MKFKHLKISNISTRNIHATAILVMCNCLLATKLLELEFYTNSKSNHRIHLVNFTIIYAGM